MSRRPLAPPIGVLALAIIAAASLGDSSRLAGSWEGTFHGGRGDQPIAIVCRPRGPSRFVGSFYLDGTVIGLIEDGRCLGDSIAFGLYAPPGHAYVPLYAGYLQSDLSLPVLLLPLGIPAWTSGDLLNALRTNSLCFELLFSFPMP